MHKFFKFFKAPRLSFDRQFSRSSINQILLLGLFVLLLFFLASIVIAYFWGDNLVGHASDVKGKSWGSHAWQLYYYFADPGNQMSMEKASVGMRVVGVIFSTLGSICLGGLLIATFTNTIERRIEQFRNGTNYYTINKHIVIIGANQMIHGIISQLIADPSIKRIIVMTAKNVEETRTDIMSGLKDKSERNRVVVNYGTPDSEEYLKKVRITRAREVYILGDDHDSAESLHDSLNIQCLKAIANQCIAEGRRDLTCNIAFDSTASYQTFRHASLPKYITEYINFHPFNFHSFWAQNVMVTNTSPNGSIKYLPLDYRPITSRDSDRYVHLIIIGLSKMGEAMALQAAHIAHFPNYERKKTRITIIDSDIRAAMHAFRQQCGELFEICKSTYIDAENGDDANLATKIQGISDKYVHLSEKCADKNFIDIEWTFINGSDSNPLVRQLLSRYASDHDAMITVAICYDQTNEALNSAQHLPAIYYERNIPILVHQSTTSSLVETLAGKDLSPKDRDGIRYKNLKPFGMVSDCYDIRLTPSLQYCKRIHAIYNHFEANGTLPETIDDTKANREWDDLLVPKKWSNVHVAASIPTKLRCLGYTTEYLVGGEIHIDPLTDDQIDMLAEIEHNRWNVEELLLGYRPVLKHEDNEIDANTNLKARYKVNFIHYDLRPYTELKVDASGRKASIYDKMIVKALPVIVNN